MALVRKIDSNITGLAYAKEAQIGVLPGEAGLPGTPVWYGLNPNSYSDFGGEITTVAPNPINPSRQRRKGVTTDLDASGGFNHNMTFFNLIDLMQGVMFAAVRQKGTEPVTAIDTDTANPDEYEVASTAGFIVGNLIKGFGFASTSNNALNVVTAVVSNASVEVADGQLVTDASPATGSFIKVVGHQFTANDLVVNTAGDLPVLTSTDIADLTTLGIVAGQWIFIGGDTTATRFGTAANNGYKRVRSVTATAITLDKSDTTMVSETTSGGQTVRIFYGDVLKNEQGGLIARSTYNVERLLGAPDDAAPNDLQSEVLKGAIPNEFVLNVPSAELLNADFSFIATDNEPRDSTLGEKQTNVRSFFAADEFNTSSDVSRINLSAVSSVNEAPVATFAFVTEATLTVNNNISPNKAVGVLGAFDVTAGTFNVSASITAYFSNISGVQAVRNNTSVTLDMIFAKNNQGIAFDMPLIGLGDGRLNVEIDEPITLPLTADAATGEDVSPDLNHTLAITYFYYLPDLAE